MSLLVKVLIVVSLCLLSIFATVYFFFNPLSESNTISIDDATIQKLCEENKHAGIVTVYTNSVGEIGGYFVEAKIETPDDAVPGWSGTLYGASGKVLAEGDSIPPFTKSKERDAKRSEVKLSYPIETVVNCTS